MAFHKKPIRIKTNVGEIRIVITRLTFSVSILSVFITGWLMNGVQNKENSFVSNAPCEVSSNQPNQRWFSTNVMAISVESRDGELTCPRRRPFPSYGDATTTNHRDEEELFFKRVNFRSDGFWPVACTVGEKKLRPRFHSCRLLTPSPHGMKWMGHKKPPPNRYTYAAYTSRLDRPTLKLHNDDKGKAKRPSNNLVYNTQ